MLAAEGESDSQSESESESEQAMTALLHAADEYPLGLVLRATLALDFMAFTEFAFGVVRPNTLFKPNWHLEALAHKLSQVASGELRRLIVTIPPRNLKSLFASVALPAWFLDHNPSERVVTVSYSDLLARIHANDFRRLVNDPIYQATFPAMRLARDTDREIVTTMRGKRYTTSIEGTLTRLGGNLVIIDDPLKQGVRIPKRSESGRLSGIVPPCRAARTTNRWHAFFSSCSVCIRTISPVTSRSKADLKS